MASVKKQRTTAAQKQLGFVLGETRVNLSNLSDPEFESLLVKALDEIDLREIRGFQELERFLTIRPGSVVTGPGTIKTHGLDLEVLNMGKEASLSVEGFEDPSIIDLKTHVLQMCRGWASGSNIYKRLETEEQTDDWSVASTWGASGYLVGGEGEILAIRRPRNHAYGGECLLTVHFRYEKVTLKNEHVISTVTVRKLTPNNFRQYFGEKSARIAVELMWGLESAYMRTVEALMSQAETIRRKGTFFKRLSGAVSYS